MGLIFFILYLFISTIFIFSKKSIFTISLVYLFIAPQIKIGTIDISPYYLILIVFIFFLLLTKKRIKIYKTYNNYLILCFVNLALYVIMTLIYNDNISFETFSSILGSTIIPMLIIFMNTLFENDIQDKKKFEKAIIIVLGINVFGVILQALLKSDIRQFFEALYVSDNYKYYLTLSDTMVYNRKFGFFASPMLLGVFCCFAFVYFFSRYIETKSNKFFKYIVITLILGITSLSKTFILGIPIIVLFYFVLNIINNKKIIFNKKRIKKTMLFLPIIIVAGIVFYNYMSKNTTIDYYIQMITNPGQALSTRYDTSADDILFSSTYKVIDRHKIFGVGLQSIEEEFLGDSTYIMAMHHGGLISLITIIVFYILEIINAFVKKDIDKMLFLIMWILSGLAMPSLFNVIIVMPFFMYFMNNSKNYKDKKER